MSHELLNIEQAVADNSSTSQSPKAAEVIASLLMIEKRAKRAKDSYSLVDLLGNWNLRLITGTKKTRKKAGIILGTGKYIPQVIQIKITYQAEQPDTNIGRVINSVKIAFIQLSLSGPMKFMPQKNILAFDFSYLKFSLGGWNLYQGHLKNGLQKEAEFQQKELKHQAFFSFFLIEDNLIAARGRGGGLALWGREEV